MESLNINNKPLEITGEEFVKILLGGKEERRRYGQFFQEEGVINIDNVVVTSEVYFKNGEVFENEINIKGGEFKKEFVFSGGEFKKNFIIYDGLFDFLFVIKSLIAQGFFWIVGGEFNHRFVIENGNFIDNFWIKGGHFHNDFLILGGNFKKDFWISGGIFKSFFNIENGNFLKEIWIRSGEFQDNFVVNGGIINSLFIEGGLFQNEVWFDKNKDLNNDLQINKFKILSGEFKRNFWIKGGNYVNFEINGGTLNKIKFEKFNDNVFIDNLIIDLVVDFFIEINDIILKSIKYKNTIKNNGVIKLNNQKINSIFFEDFINQGLIIFNNVHFENLNTIKIYFLNSTIGRFEIKDTNLNDKNLELNIKNTDFTKVIQYNTNNDFNFTTEKSKIKLYNEGKQNYIIDEIKLKTETENMHVQTFRDLAVAARIQDDYDLYYKYHYAHQEALLVTNKRDKKWSSYYSILFNKWTTNYGDDWIKGVKFFVIISLILFILSSIVRILCECDIYNLTFKFNFWGSIYEYLRFINPISNIFNNKIEDIYKSNLGKIVYFFSQFIFILLYYQIIQAFRKFRHKF